MTITIIIEGEGASWTASRPDWAELGEAKASTPVAAVRALNIKAYLAHIEREKTKEAAFKSMKRHFRAGVGYPMWAPHWLLRRLHGEKVDRHYQLIQEVAREFDARGGGDWAALAATVNERWTG